MSLSEEVLSLRKSSNTRFGTARTPHHLPFKDKDKAKDKDKDSDSCNHTNRGG